MCEYVGHISVLLHFKRWLSLSKALQSVFMEHLVSVHTLYLARRFFIDAGIFCLSLISANVGLMVECHFYEIENCSFENPHQHYYAIIYCLKTERRDLKALKN